MAGEPDITVLIATHDRADILRETLEALADLNYDDLTVEYVIIDNNSRDNTKEVIESFKDRLPLRYLYEPRPGKNCALNHAIGAVALGEVVVFTDDDITPDADWLTAMAATTRHWPDISVFGGRIDLIWPDVEIPAWAENPRLQGFAFGGHQRTGGEALYPPHVFPFGGNLWVRRRVFDGGRRFDESVGPRPTNRIMGSETTFLQKLEDDGYRMVYGPDAVVGHRVQPETLSARAVHRRAYRQGRGMAHWRGIAYPDRYRQSRWSWYLVCLASIVELSILLACLMIFLPPTHRLEADVNVIGQLARRIESLRLARRTGKGA